MATAYNSAQTAAVLPYTIETATGDFHDEPITHVSVYDGGFSVSQESNLTTVEMRTLVLSALGHPKADISQILYVSPGAVTSQVQNIDKKLTMHSVVEAVHQAFEQHIFQPTASVAAKHFPVTYHEARIMLETARGATAAQIARALHTNETTIQDARFTIYEKIGISSPRMQALAVTLGHLTGRFAELQATPAAPCVLE